MHKKKFYERFLKRPIDFILSSLAILFFSPLLLIVAFLVKIKLGSPILFKQQRPGLNEKKFVIYKFRTMTNKKDTHGNLLPDKDRSTKFGKFLRTTSFDELPGLFNIFKGDMSIIGPRPLLTKYLPLYNEKQKRRHEVRPGLSGLAQVNGRNTLTWEAKFDYDIKYIDNITFFGDVVILFRTIKKVLVREGISSNTSITMEAFNGMKEEKK